MLYKRLLEQVLYPHSWFTLGSTFTFEDPECIECARFSVGYLATFSPFFSLYCKGWKPGDYIPQNFYQQGTVLYWHQGHLQEEKSLTQWHRHMDFRGDRCEVQTHCDSLWIRWGRFLWFLFFLIFLNTGNDFPDPCFSSHPNGFITIQSLYYISFYF